MRDVHIAAHRFAALAGGGQHPGMLAGAVIMQCGGQLAGGDHCVACLLVHWPLRAAQQVAVSAVDSLEPSRDPRCVHRFAGMAGAGQRQLFRADAECISCPSFDYRQGLQRLDGRTRVD